MRKLLLSLILFAFLAWPVLAMAQTSTTTEPKRQNAAEAINVKLQVPLPFVPMTCKDKEGNPAVCKLTDYIAGMYRLLVGLGVLFAVVMFIIAGYQWIFAGGSADKIGAAKKRIMGAVIGLILALLSYVILNSISARLVELRLPLVDPVPPIAFLGGNYCQISEELKNYEHKMGKSEGQLELTSTTVSSPSATSPGGLAVSHTPTIGQGDIIKRTDALCGQEYRVLGVDSLGVCRGNVCKEPPDTACINDKCLPIYLYGTIAWGVAAGDYTNFFGNAYVDFLDVYAICGNSAKAVQHLDVGEKRRRYDFIKNSVDRNRGSEVPSEFEAIQNIGAEPGASLPAYKEIAQQCGSGFKGFALRVEVNDDTGWLSTNDDTFAIGKSCSKPFGWLASGVGAPSFGGVNWAVVNQNELFSLDDFDRGVRCDLNINRDNFPTR